MSTTLHIHLRLKQLTDTCTCVDQHLSKLLTSTLILPVCLFHSLNEFEHRHISLNDISRTAQFFFPSRWNLYSLVPLQKADTLLNPLPIIIYIQYREQDVDQTRVPTNIHKRAFSATRLVSRPYSFPYLRSNFQQTNGTTSLRTPNSRSRWSLLCPIFHYCAYPSYNIRDAKQLHTFGACYTYVFIFCFI